MNELQAALYRDLAEVLISEQLGGRTLTADEWWIVYRVREIAAGNDA